MVRSDFLVQVILASRRIGADLPYEPPQIAEFNLEDLEPHHTLPSHSLPDPSKPQPATPSLDVP